MSIQSRISSFYDLGHFFRVFLEKELLHFNDLSFDESQFLESIVKAEAENPWFTRSNILMSLRQWSQVLTKDNLLFWTKDYTYSQNARNVGVILAGNLPLVGFHDVLSVLLSGHNLTVKTSSKDNTLMEFVLNFLSASNPELKAAIRKVERLNEFDAIIATGSNNTARYFEYYFRQVPHIIRKNRTSIAVLNGDESSEDLKNLSHDIFSYFGLGCRNVTKLYLPNGYNTDLLFEAFFDWEFVIHHAKYANNYEYNRAVYLLSKDVFLDNNFVILKESKELHSPVGVVYFEFYKDKKEVEEELKNREEEIQCVVGRTFNSFDNLVEFGETQHPTLTDYADGIDVMRFLEAL